MSKGQSSGAAERTPAEVGLDYIADGIAASLADSQAFTPGPWGAFKSGIYSAGGLCVATRHPQAGREWIANAPLLAATPELLEALQNLLALHHEEPGTYTWQGSAARAAVRKALDLS